MNASKGEMHLIFMKNAQGLWIMKIINLLWRCISKRFLDILVKIVSVECKGQLKGVQAEVRDKLKVQFVIKIVHSELRGERRTEGCVVREARGQRWISKHRKDWWLSCCSVRVRGERRCEVWGDISEVSGTDVFRIYGTRKKGEL